MSDDGLFVPDGKTHAPGCCVHFPGGANACDCYLSWMEEVWKNLLDWMEEMGDESRRTHRPKGRLPSRRGRG